MYNRNLGPYGQTPITDSGYLDILKPRTVPTSGDDLDYEITSAYEHRPDLLAYDLYGNRELWWVFAQRNPDVIIDPVYDFVPGVQIKLPQGKHLRSSLGI